MNPSLRARVIAEWRGMRETPFTQDTSKPVAETVSKVMIQLGLGDRLKEDEVLRAWREIVGDFIATHSTPQRLKDGVLYVRVLQPSVHFELDRQRRFQNVIAQDAGRRIAIERFHSPDEPLPNPIDDRQVVVGDRSMPQELAFELVGFVRGELLDRHRKLTVVLERFEQTVGEGFGDERCQCSPIVSDLPG